MLKAIIYYSSYVFVFCLLVGLFLSRRHRAQDILFIVGISLIPIGKLFYMPVPGLTSVKAAFLFTALVGSISLVLNWIRGVERYIFLPFIFLLPGLVSILFLYPPSQDSFIVATSGGGGNGSTLLRLVSVFLTSAYCSYVILHVSRNENSLRDISRYYISASLFSTLIGAIITYGLFVGQLNPAELIPVSVQEVHMVGRMFRFNPGANVNEFGQIVGYALLMLRWTGWRPLTKLLMALALIAAEILSLTRGAWLGLVVAYLVYALFTETKQRLRLFVVGGLAMLILLVTAMQSDVIYHLILTRTDLSAGAGGEDRLRTATALYDALAASPLRLLFGYGWSTDVFASDYGFDFGYIHSVPLMMLFDTGVVGVMICIFALFAIGKFAFDNIQRDRDIIAGLAAFMFTVSLLEHNFFHVQTWLIMGLIMGLALRASRIERSTRQASEQYEAAQ